MAENKKKKRLKESLNDTEIKEERNESRHIRNRYLISLAILAFAGINGFLLFTDPPAIKDMYDYNGNVELERVKLSEYKESVRPEDQTKYDDENHQLEITLKEKQDEEKKMEEIADVAAKGEKDLEKKITELTKIKDTKTVEKYIDALNKAEYAQVPAKDRLAQREEFENQVPKGGTLDEKK